MNINTVTCDQLYYIFTIMNLINLLVKMIHGSVVLCVHHRRVCLSVCVCTHTLSLSLSRSLSLSLSLSVGSNIAIYITICSGYQLRGVG